MSRRRYVAVLAMIGAVACKGDSASREAWLVRSRPATVDVAVDRWLACVECSDGELGDLMGFGSQAVAILTRILREGPDSGAVAETRDALQRRWPELRAATGRDPSRPFTIPLADYVDAGVTAFTVSRRVRAAFALGQIGGTDARDALQATLATSPPQAVADAIAGALAAM